MIPHNLISEYNLHKITIFDIAKAISKCPTTAYLELKKLGIKTNYYRVKTRERNIEIIKYYEEGMSQLHISQIFNLTKQRIHQIIKNKEKYYETQNNQS